MTALKLPAPDAPASEWGRLAMSIPDWRWMPQMLDVSGLILLEPVNEQSLKVKCWDMHDPASLGTYSSWLMLPDPDDPATAGCLLALLGPGWVHRIDDDGSHMLFRESGKRFFASPSLGRACIAAADANGRWSGGEK
jgi:hypothetical protein